jgi:hypothetical protein
MNKMDLKQFWNEEEKLALADSFNPNHKYWVVHDLRLAQGKVFWERGGKQFAYDRKFILSNSQELKDWIEDAKENIFDQTSDSLNARDFLDALACLGKEKVKKLIKELK